MKSDLPFLDTIEKIAESTEIILRNADGGRVEVSGWCAIATVVSHGDIGTGAVTMADVVRFVFRTSGADLLLRAVDHGAILIVVGISTLFGVVLGVRCAPPTAARSPHAREPH